MATTISFPTAVTINGASFDKTFADDGQNTTHPSGGWGSEGDIELYSFSSLSIPSGATINGIEILAEAGSNTGANEPHMFVYNGSSWSSALANNGTFGKSGSTIDPAWGSSSNLWGLSWTPATAEGIKIKMDSSSITAGRRIFIDYVKVRVTYTEASGYGHDVNGVTAANIGKINGVATASISKVNGV